MHDSSVVIMTALDTQGSGIDSPWKHVQRLHIYRLFLGDANVIFCGKNTTLHKRFSRRFQSVHAVHVFFTLAFDRSLPASLPPFLQTISLSLSSVLCLPVASAVIGLIKSAPDTGLRVTPMIPPRNSLAVGEVATCTVVSPQ